MEHCVIQEEKEDEMQTCFEESCTREKYIIQMNNLIGYSKVNSGCHELANQKMIECSQGIAITMDLMMEHFEYKKQEVNPMLVDIDMPKLQIYLFEPDYNFFIKLLQENLGEQPQTVLPAEQPSLTENVILSSNTLILIIICIVLAEFSDQGGEMHD